MFKFYQKLRCILYSHYIAIPGQVSSRVDDVINVATKGQTTLFKASEVLEQTMEAYRYARFAARDNFDLKRQSGQLLRDYDETLKAMIKCRLDSHLDEASQKEEECSRQLGECRRLAEWNEARAFLYYASYS